MNNEQNVIDCRHKPLMTHYRQQQSITL